jgi:hypothetical protein
VSLSQSRTVVSSLTLTSGPSPGRKAVAYTGPVWPRKERQRPAATGRMLQAAG